MATNTPATGQFAWGVDISTKRVAIAAWNGQQAAWTVVEIPPDRRGGGMIPPDAGWVATKVTAAAIRFARSYPPLIAWVEQPSGRFPNPRLLYVAGATIGALQEGLRVLYRAPVMVAVIAPSRWRVAALGAGNGHASKQTVLAWARERGLDADDYDRADALGVAVAGTELTLLEDEAAA